MLKLVKGLFLAALMAAFFSGSVVYSKTKSKSSSGSTRAESLTIDSPVHESYFSDFEYEVQTALTNGGLSTYKARDSNYTVLDLKASVSKVIKNNIQAGGEVHLNNTSGGDSSSYLEFLAFGVYNLDNNLKESLYGKAGVGLINVVSNSGKNETKVGLLVGGGKRIPLFDKVTYTPELRIVLVDGTTRFEIQAINFSLLF